MTGRAIRLLSAALIASVLLLFGWVAAFAQEPTPVTAEAGSVVTLEGDVKQEGGGASAEFMVAMTGLASAGTAFLVLLSRQLLTTPSAKAQTKELGTQTESLSEIKGDLKELIGGSGATTARLDGIDKELLHVRKAQHRAGFDIAQLKSHLKINGPGAPPFNPGDED